MINRLKSVYISVFSGAAAILMLIAGWQLAQAGTLASPWLGALLAGGAPSAFFGWVFLSGAERTRPRLWPLHGATALGTLLAFGFGGGWPAWLAGLIGLAGGLVYDFWYSRNDDRDASVLAPDRILPAFSLEAPDGTAVASSDLLAQPTIWLFYRGNWCPFCMAQVKEIAAQYRELTARGAQVVLVSPQPEAQTRALAAKFDVPMRFLIDRDNQAARTLRIDAAHGLPAGMQLLGYASDVPLPTVFITAAGGRILYADLADNYRIRPEPDAFLQVLERAG
ncbi:MAG: peroxiredoxin-like family protein [Oceanococcaceae bacterium]